MPRQRSYFKELNPFVRDGEGKDNNPFGCKGYKLSCEDHCASYVNKETLESLPPFTLNNEEIERVDGCTQEHNWLLPAHSEFFSPDINDKDRKLIIDWMKESGNQTFFLLSKDILAMREAKFAAGNIYWSYSASSQAELNFVASVLSTDQGNLSPGVNQALFLAPMAEEIEFPKLLWNQFDYIFIWSLFGRKGDEFKLEWLEKLEEDLGKDRAIVIVDRLTRPTTYQGKPIPKNALATQKKPVYSQTIKELLERAKAAL